MASQRSVKRQGDACSESSMGVGWAWLSELCEEAMERFELRLSLEPK